MKYWVRYVQNSHPKLKKFTSLKKAKLFTCSFRRLYPADPVKDQGNWIDYIIVGDIIEADEYFKDMIKPKKKEAVSGE